MELKDIKKIVEESFKKHFSNYEELIYIGGSEDIQHCAYIINDKECYEIIAEFKVSEQGVYDGTLRSLSAWFLKHFADFKREITAELCKITFKEEQE